MVSKFFNTIHISMILFIVFAITVIYLGIYCLIAPGKIKTFSCDRTPIEMHCQLENPNWWKSTIETFVENDILGVEVEKVREGEVYQYYVNLLVETSQKHHLFPHNFELDAKQEAAKINDFLKNYQAELLTISKDATIIFYVMGGFCLTFGIFSLGIAIFSLVRYWFYT
jgi:hypothetical protein